MPIEEIPEEYREKIARLRELIVVEKTVYEKVIEWLESHEGKLPRNNIRKKLTAAEMTPEQKEEVNLCQRWYKSEEKKKLDEYAGVPIEEIPEEYRGKIARLRELIVVVKKTTAYEEVIEWLEAHEGKLPSAGKETTEAEKKLYHRWYSSKERQKLEKYAEVPIEEIPEEYRGKIAKLRELIVVVKKTAYEEVIEWLESHEGKLPSQRKEATEAEKKLAYRWKNSEERKKLAKYAEVPIEKIPQKYREKIARLRELIVVEEKKTTYEQVAEWLETHEGKLPSQGKKASKEEVNLYNRWFNSEERRKLDEYVGVPIEEIPEEYREKIEKLRELMVVEKTAYEEVIEWLESHEGKLPSLGKKATETEKKLAQRWNNSKERKKLDEYAGVPIEEISEEYREKIVRLRELIAVKKTTYEEVIEWLETHEGKLHSQGTEKKLYQKWYKSEEKKKLDEYAGVPIYEVPEEYREKIAKLREFGIMGKRKLNKVKQQRDEAKSENDKAKELEKEVEEELKRKGRIHSER